MPIYRFTARDSLGQLVVGTRGAADEVIARRDLREDGLFVIALEDQKEAKGLADFWARLRGVKLGDMVVFSQQLATMIGAGLPIIECLHELIDETENSALRRALVEINRDIQSGATFSQAMARHPRIFSEMFVALVHAGEVGGVLDQSLATMADALDKEQELREKVRSAFVYPIVVLVAAAGVVAVMLLFIIPVFEKVYAQFHAQLPTPTLVLMTVSRFLIHFWWMGLLGLGAVVWGVRAFLRTDSGRLLWDRVKLRLPLLGKLIRKMTVLRFVRTLGALVAAGVPILSAIDTATRVAGNTEFTSAIAKVKGEVTDGASLSAPIRACGKFPNLVPRLIQVGEESGNLDTMLEKIAHFYDRDIEYTVKRLTTLMEPALTVVLGGIVGSIVIALYMPIFTLATVIRR